MITVPIEEQQSVLLKAIAAKTPHANQCGIQTWLTVQRLFIPRLTIQTRIEECIDAGLVIEVEPPPNQHHKCRVFYQLTDAGTTALGL